MENRKLIIVTIIFFLLININYYLEEIIGFLMMPLFIISILLYIILFVLMLGQLIKSIQESFSNKKRLISIGIVMILLALIYSKPNGVINYDSFNKSILIANNEGGGNCSSTLKLKDDNTFKQRNVCFGVEIIKGNYSVINDTIFFKNNSNYKYRFATITKGKNNSQLFFYTKPNDSVVGKMNIIKNLIF